MIQNFIDCFLSNKETIRKSFARKHPTRYVDLVKIVIRALEKKTSSGISSKNIHKIDDGDHSGVLLFIIGEGCYQPSKYWYVRIEYGSCSACDTLNEIRQYDDGKPSNEQVDSYMMLALHIVERLKEIEGDIVEMRSVNKDMDSDTRRALLDLGSTGTQE
jgi:hypothetical protein